MKAAPTSGFRFSTSTRIDSLVWKYGRGSECMKIQKPGILFLIAWVMFVGAGVVENGQAPRDQATRLAELDGLEFERSATKGAPFSATLVIEISPAGSDNAATTRKSISVLYRDGEGRTRRDQMPSETTEASLPTQAPLLTTINDPVAGYTFTVNGRANIARRSEFGGEQPASSNRTVVQGPESRSPAEGNGSGQTLPVPGTAYAKQKAPTEVRHQISPARRELLGQREIEGFTAEGTRVTMTIPIGAIGNEHPLTTSVERWYSPELKTVLLIERSDPRMGRTTWRLSGIQRTEPSAALFTVPSSFKITDN
jgi:hypothetical protein